MLFSTLGPASASSSDPSTYLPSVSRPSTLPPLPIKLSINPTSAPPLHHRPCLHSLDPRPYPPAHPLDRVDPRPDLRSLSRLSTLPPLPLSTIDPTSASSLNHQPYLYPASAPSPDPSTYLPS
eukprot:855163-Rhodomonas_salina.1